MFKRQLKRMVLLAAVSISSLATSNVVYTITYNPGKYGVGAIKTVEKLKDETITIEGALFTTEGHRQTGWRSSETSHITHPFGSSYSLNESLTLYPYWSANTYTVHFDANGGEGTMEDMAMQYAVPTNLTLNAFSKGGYVFEGWATNRDGSVVYADGARVKNLTSAHAVVVTLYARWALSTASRTWFVDAASGSDANDGRNSSSAFATIQKAIDSAKQYDHVIVGDGVYSPIVATNLALTIESINGAEYTIIDGDKTKRCAELGEYGGLQTLLSGFTLRNGNDPEVTYYDDWLDYYYTESYGGGAYYGVLCNCVIELNSAYDGGGVYSSVLTNCTLRNNTASYGGAGASGKLVKCTIENNYAEYSGGGVYGGTINYCVVSNNTAKYGGGAYSASATNCLFVSNVAQSDGGAFNGGNSSYQNYGCNHCTFYGNQAENGGGMYKGTALNCIFWSNTATTGGDACKTEISYSCVMDISERVGSGEGNVSGNPMFVDADGGDFHLKVDSLCVNAGRGDWQTYLDEQDLDGEPRLRGGRTDMGVYELDVPDVSSIVVLPVAGGSVYPMTAMLPIGSNMTFVALGPRPFIGFFTNSVLLSAERTLTISGDGSSDIIIEARFDMTVSNLMIYADAVMGSMFANGLTRFAPMTLQAAIEISQDGDVIICADGTYQPIETHNKAITIQSANGCEYAIIDGGNSNRCAVLGNAKREANTKLVGWTLRNGNANSQNGGCSFYGHLIDCVAENGNAVFGGGGYGGVYDSCVFRDNTATQGGGVHGGACTNCLIESNSASAWGGGAGGSPSLSRCVIRNNISEYGAGGVSGGDLIECIIEGNHADANNGGGTHESVAKRCVFKDNSAMRGGGAYGGRLENCLIVNNSAGRGGGCYAWNSELILINCTIYNNEAVSGGGGIYCSSEENSWASYASPSGTGPGYHWTASYGAMKLYDAYQPCPLEIDASYCDSICANNSIIWGNSLKSGSISNYESYPNGKGIWFQNCCTYPFPVRGSGNISSDPLLCLELANEYALSEESPCINAGSEIIMETSVWEWDSFDFSYVDYDCSWYRTVISETELDLRGNPRKMDGHIDMGAYETVKLIERELTFEDIWGEWSSEETQSYVVPESVATWDALARVLWQSRDAYVKSGARTEVPPSEGAIVLSLGAMSVPESLMTSQTPIETEIEHGVSVWRLRVFEDTNTCALVAVAGKTAFELSALPSYLANEWVNAVYGQPPAWLDVSETEAWYAARARSRIEWFITLVPQSQWATYCANRVSEAAGTRTRSGENSLTITGFRPDSATAIHNVSVRSSVSGETRLWSKDSLSSTNWTYNGYSLQAPGTTAAGVHSVSNQLFVTATFSEVALDSDGDGIPDVVEEKVYGTNPNKADSSGDGISDWEKVYRYGLNPRVQDTAGDGISDDEKMLYGADPRVPLTPEQKAAASRSIRYTYDDDDRLTGTFFGLGGASIKTELTPAGNPADIRNRNATK